jgi:hypothetical protein
MVADFTSYPSVTLFHAHVDVDMTKWHDLTTVWSVNALGTQRVDFFVDDSYLSGTNLATPLPSLTLELAQTNQERPSLFQVGYVSPTQEQDYDINSIKMFQN